MSPGTSRFAVFCFVLLAVGLTARGGMTADTPYTEQGKTDFDTILQILNPYGTWSKIAGKWAFTPRDHAAPYTNGRWIYTEYGWCWKGNLPHSWATEHYGYWKLSADKVWSWYPGPFWLPEIVEIRATSKYIGWHCAEVDENGDFVEPPIDRFSKPEEWTFVTLSQFANPITPDIVAAPDVVKRQLEDSTDCRHTYLTYREIDRPGPHPADFADLCKDGKMLAPLLARDLETDQTVSPSPTPSAPNLPPTNAAGVVPPQLVGNEINPAADTRKVKYWITMSLPTYWTKPPFDAKLDEIYLYRPDFYQDRDGIERRVTLWFNPRDRPNLTELLGGEMPTSKSTGKSRSATDASPAQPASEGNPFHSPLDDTFQPDYSPTSPNASTKRPATSGTNPAPSGLANPAPSR
jgi:hypothetical protein